PGDAGVRLDRDAFPALVLGLLLAAEEIAQHVALHNGEPPAFVEVRHRDAGGGDIDEVVGDQRALERKLRVERDLAEARAGVGDDLNVRGGVAADRGVGAVVDAVARHQDIPGSKRVDAVSVLAGAAAVGADALDAVVGDDAAILTLFRAPDLDTVVGAVGDAIV